VTWLQFISSIVGSLAWPVCSVIIALVFRKRLSDLLAKLLKLNLPGGISAEFEKGLAKVEGAATIADATEVMPEPGKIEITGYAPIISSVPGTVHVSEGDGTMRAEGTVSDSNKNGDPGRQERTVFKLSDLAGPGVSVFDFYDASVAQPAGVVMEAWKLLEAEIVATVAELFPDFKAETAQGFNVGKLLTVLVKKGVLTQDDAIVFQDMRRLRNLAAHSQEPVSPSEARRFATLSAAMGEKLKRRQGPATQ
jgi:hypothetical protein